MRSIEFIYYFIYLCILMKIKAIDKLFTILVYGSINKNILNLNYNFLGLIFFYKLLWHQSKISILKLQLCT